MFDFQEASSATTHLHPAVANYVQQATDVHNFLMWQSDLSPRNTQLNSKLSAFVHETMRARPYGEATAILRTPQIKEIAPSLRRLLGKAEYEMERYCAAAFVGEESAHDKRYASYDNFIYRNNYEALIEHEMKAMGWPLKQPPLDQKTESVAFVGAGPLPISAIMFHLRTGHPVTCIDNDAEACRLGSKLLRHMAKSDKRYAALGSKMSYVHVDGQDHDYVTHPIVFIAALVEAKDPVVSKFMITSDTASTMVVRTAEGLSALLYPPHKCVGGLEEYNFYFKSKTKPSADAINTSLVFGMPPGKLRTRNKIDFVRPEDIRILDPHPRPMWRTNAKDLSI